MILQFAHGIGQVYALPVPLQYYLLGSALTVAVSFFLFAYFLNRHDDTVNSERIISAPWLPATLRLIKYLTFALLLIIITTGLFGIQESILNFGPYYFWTVFVIGFSIVSVLIGNLWKYISPFNTLANLISLKRRTGQPMPELTWWASSFFLISLFWFELVSKVSYVPSVLAAVLLIYSLVSVYLDSQFKDWLDRGELFAVLFSILGNLSYVRISNDGRFLIIAKPTQRIAHIVAPKNVLLFASILLAGASFDSFKQTLLWFDILRYVGIYGPVLTSTAETIGLILFPVPFLMTYLVSIKIMKRLTNSKLSWRVLGGHFAWSLLPIAFGYTLAHNFALIITSLPILASLLSDPFGIGWNLFDTVNTQGQALILGARYVWFIQIGLVITAHIIGVWFAHITAQKVFKTKEEIIRSQYPVVILMLGYTILTLWLLSQAVVV